MMDKENILKNKPDYEEYTENEVKLSIAEMRELGMLSCGGCCSKSAEGNKKCGGCNKEKKCCKSI